MTSVSTPNPIFSTPNPIFSDHDLVKLATGQLIKKSLLRNSQLYSSLLDSYDNCGNHGSDQQRRQQQHHYQREEQLLMPVPDSISSDVIDDYIGFLDTERLVATIKKSLKACSLLDDQLYLKFCVKRLLSNFSKCKDVLDEISDVHLEDICMLIPKDLWPERFQNSDKLLSRWLHKYHYDVVKRQDERSSHGEDYIQFIVNDHVYTYSFLNSQRDPGSDYDYVHNSGIFVVCNVTTVQAAKYVHEKLSYICGDAWRVTYPRLGADLYHKKLPLPEEVTAGHQPTFIIRDLFWNYDNDARSDEIECSITAGYKFRITYRRWCKNDGKHRYYSVYDSGDSSEEGDERIYLGSDNEDNRQRHLGSDDDENNETTDDDHDDDINASSSSSTATRRPERGRGRGRGMGRGMGRGRGGYW